MDDRPTTTTQLDYETSWRELLHSALNSVFPSERKFEELLDNWERMP